MSVMKKIDIEDAMCLELSIMREDDLLKEFDLGSSYVSVEFFQTTTHFNNSI